MKPSVALNRAREEALRGNSEVAIDALRRIAAEGDTAACPSLAEMLAFKGA
jgi:TPR repeat protein